MKVRWQGAALATALGEIDGLLAGPLVGLTIKGAGHLEDLLGGLSRLVHEETLLAARVRANGVNPWDPPPTFGTLLRLARMNVAAELRKRGAV
jgi:hypothetical protein